MSKPKKVSVAELKLRQQEEDALAFLTSRMRISPAGVIVPRPVPVHEVDPNAPLKCIAITASEGEQCSKKAKYSYLGVPMKVCHLHCEREGRVIQTIEDVLVVEEEVADGTAWEEEDANPLN
jgi:hypothetical protein